jgi:hypothetical protein
MSEHMDRNAPQERNLVHDSSVTDETARLYDVPVDQATYDHLKAITLPEEISRVVSSNSGLSTWLKCAESMQIVWLSHDKEGPKAYLSADPEGQAERRVEIVRKLDGHLRSTDTSKASYTNPSLPDDIREAMQARLDAALAKFPDEMAKLLKAREADIVEGLDTKTVWTAKLEKGRHEDGLASEALISPDPWWQAISSHKTVADNHWAQHWLMQLRQSLANSFEQQAGWKLEEVVENAIPNLASHRFKVEIARPMMGRDLGLWAFHKDRR